MSLDVKFSDAHIFCYEEARKHLHILRFYLIKEQDPKVADCYKAVMRSIVLQHKNFLLQAAAEEKIELDPTQLQWVDDMLGRI